MHFRSIFMEITSTNLSTADGQLAVFMEGSHHGGSKINLLYFQPLGCEILMVDLYLSAMAADIGSPICIYHLVVDLMLDLVLCELIVSSPWGICRFTAPIGRFLKNEHLHFRPLGREIIDGIFSQEMLKINNVYSRPIGRRIYICRSIISRF